MSNRSHPGMANGCDRDDVAALADALLALKRLPDLIDRLEAIVDRIDPQEPDRREVRAPDDVQAYSVKDFTKRSGLSNSYLRKAIATGQLKSVKVGGRRLIPVSEARAFITRGC